MSGCVRMDSIPLSQRISLVRNAIAEAGPRHFNIDTWFSKRDGIFAKKQVSLGMAEEIDIKKCGTTACIAGHTLLVAHDLGIHMISVFQASEFLGLRQNAFDPVTHPFSSHYWMNKGYFGRRETYRGVLQWLDYLILDAQAREVWEMQIQAARMQSQLAAKIESLREVQDAELLSHDDEPLVLASTSST